MPDSSLPTISVVMPNFNHGKYLSTSLPAILNQSVQPLEIIIIDDGSTDNSWDIILGYTRRHPVIRAIRNEKNLGVIANGNKGLELARGEYIHFGSADDEIYPGLFEKSLKLLKQHPQAAYCCTIGDWHELATGFNWHVSVGMADAPCYLPPERMVELERQSKFFIASHTTVLKRQAFIEVGSFIPELKWHADWFVLYACGFRHGICYIPEPLARFNIFTTSYYKSGRRDEAAHRAVLQGILDRLASPEFAREAEFIRQGGSLFQFAGPVRELMRHDPRFKDWLTPLMLRRSYWHSVKLAVKDHLPVWLANLYFRLAGYRAPKSA